MSVECDKAYEHLVKGEELTPNDKYILKRYASDKVKMKHCWKDASIRDNFRSVGLLSESRITTLRPETKVKSDVQKTGNDTSKEIGLTKTGTDVKKAYDILANIIANLNLDNLPLEAKKLLVKQHVDNLLSSSDKKFLTDYSLTKIKQGDQWLSQTARNNLFYADLLGTDAEKKEAADEFKKSDRYLELQRLLK
jgi:hypothetical protein